MNDLQMFVYVHLFGTILASVLSYCKGRIDQAKKDRKWYEDRRQI